MLEVEATVDEADFTTRDARDLGIKEKVSEFTTYFPYAEYRNINIGRAAELVDGTVLKPGETFSLNGVVGERTGENGFTTGFVISNGIFKEDLGGGVSQMATTTFNAMFFAGLEGHRAQAALLLHRPLPGGPRGHGGLADRSTCGSRTTPSYGVLIDAWVTPSTPSSQGSVTVRMYSTKVWDITSSTSERYAYVGPGTRTLDTPDCYPNTGFSGFQIDVTRIFKQARRVRGRPHREVPHVVHPGRHGHLQAARLPRRRRRWLRCAEELRNHCWWGLGGFEARWRSHLNRRRRGSVGCGNPRRLRGR